MWALVGIPQSYPITQANVVRVVFVVRRAVLLVEFVENPERLAFGEDADGFDGFTALVVPAAFFWATVVFPDAVDGNGCGFTFELNEAVVPVSEAFGALAGRFLVPAGKSVHLIAVMIASVMSTKRRITISTGWRSSCC